MRRAALVAMTGALAVARLGGALPLSGHALFLTAALAFDARAPDDARRLRLALAAIGLSVTAFYKLFVWDDPAWFVAATGVGAAIGVVFRRRV